MINELFPPIITMMFTYDVYYDGNIMKINTFMNKFS